MSFALSHCQRYFYLFYLNFVCFLSGFVLSSILLIHYKAISYCNIVSMLTYRLSYMKEQKSATRLMSLTNYDFMPIYYHSEWKKWTKNNIERAKPTQNIKINDCFVYLLINSNISLWIVEQLLLRHFQNIFYISSIYDRHDIECTVH